MKTLSQLIFDHLLGGGSIAFDRTTVGHTSPIMVRLTLIRPLPDSPMKLCRDVTVDPSCVADEAWEDGVLKSVFRQFNQEFDAGPPKEVLAPARSDDGEFDDDREPDDPSGILE